MRKTTAEAHPAPSNAPGNVGDVRKANLARVLAVIAGAHSEHRLSRADIATRSKLTKASVSSLVADLLESGLIIEIGVHRDGERGHLRRASRFIWKTADTPDCSALEPCG